MIKAAFSTVGCPLWDFSEIIGAAKDFSYYGVELRGLKNQLNLTEAAEFKPENIDKTIKLLNKTGIKIPVIATNCYMFKDDKAVIDECNANLELANKLSSQYIRVLGDEWVTPSEFIDDEIVIKNLKTVAAKAEQLSVVVLLETNGVYSDTKRIKKVIDAVNSPYVAVLWDINHPFRNFNEAPTETYNNLKGKVNHVHYKDSMVVDGKVVYKLPGKGDMPIGEIISLLKSDGYDGCISLEWVKRWNNELEEPGVVIAMFAGYISSLDKS